MKVFLFTKKTLLFISIVFILITTCFLFMFFKSNETLAVELSYNSCISDEFKEKISELVKGEEKNVYLTFDDGPNKVVTPKVLDILKEEDVKATFFVIGKNVLQYPEIVRRAYEEGHFIANHGYDHNNTNLYKSRENFINEIRKTDNEIGKAIGVEDYCSHVFRFPNGFMAPNDKSKKNEAAKLLSEMNYTYIDWNCLNNDSMKKYNKSQLMKNLKKSSKDKNTLVVLMHDTKDVSDSSTVLKESIEYFRQQGYKFKNFYDLLDKE